MNSTEKELLSRFLQQLSSAQAGQKDAEAETLIRETVSRQPDAAYLLTQRTIQLEQLLAASQAELHKLQAQSRPGGASASGFLGDANAWGRSAGVNPAQSLAHAPAAPPRPGMAAQAAPASSWGSGLFGNIAATAAGVVAGSFLFQGIQGLMNRNNESDTQSASSDWGPSHHEASNEASNEPELLNSYDTPAHGGGDSFADLGDSGGDLG